MKLELKYIAPYLPYGLKVQAPATVTSKGRRLIPSIHTLGLDNIEDILTYQATKLILRPLNDLTKKIEHNGEKFVPIEWLDDNLPTLNCTAILRNDYRILDIVCSDGIIREVSFKEIFDLSQKLFEWHFDVFGLIEKELAIDINY